MMKFLALIFIQFLLMNPAYPDQIWGSLPYTEISFDGEFQELRYKVEAAVDRTDQTLKYFHFSLNKKALELPLSLLSKDSKVMLNTLSITYLPEVSVKEDNAEKVITHERVRVSFKYLDVQCMSDLDYEDSDLIAIYSSSGEFLSGKVYRAC